MRSDIISKGTYIQGLSVRVLRLGALEAVRPSVKKNHGPTAGGGKHGMLTRGT